MSRRDDLIALRDAAQAGKAFHLDAPQRKWRAAEYPCLGGYYQDSMAYGAFHGSLDAALAFLAAVLPGWDWGRQPSISEIYVFNACGDAALARRTKFGGINDDPARALLLATLNALIADADT